jgi:uncharacterized membrane protein YedE/YeeE
MGVLFGCVLSGIGFTSWDEVHNMFSLADFRLILVFAMAVPLLMLTWMLIYRLRGDEYPTRTLHPGTVTGGVIFGIGWALSGVCPSIAVVQLGEGQLAAGWTIVGIFLGNYLYSVVHQKYFRWTVTSCAGD